MVRITQIINYELRTEKVTSFLSKSLVRTRAITDSEMKMLGKLGTLFPLKLVIEHGVAFQKVTTSFFVLIVKRPGLLIQSQSYLAEYCIPVHSGYTFFTITTMFRALTKIRIC